MTKRFLPLALVALFGVSALTATTHAQTFEDYQQHQSDLVALAAVFGELHHIRRNCDPRREADTWRERMKQLVELEEPQPAAREEMVAAFNKGYRNAQQRYRTCNRNARDQGARRAALGEAIVERLASELVAAQEEAELNDGPLILQPPAEPMEFRE